VSRFNPTWQVVRGAAVVVVVVVVYQSSSKQRLSAVANAVVRDKKRRCKTGQQGEGEENIAVVCGDIYYGRQTQAHPSKQLTLTFTRLPFTATAAPQWHGSDRQQDVSDPAQHKSGI
jgi:uncharacterized membrane protein